MKRKKISGALKSEYRWGLLLCSPPLIGVLVFLLIPMILSLVLSVSELHGYMIEKMSLLPLSNLFGNYGYVLTDPLFWKSMGNTFIYALSLPLSLVVSLVISSMLVSMKRLREF
ncbi:MAG: sugar ABC transporter permease, partial [Clostridia bacterium]|nr:sugar ABC transporter permease [Clostridia bacterium]